MSTGQSPYRNTLLQGDGVEQPSRIAVDEIRLRFQVRRVGWYNHMRRIDAYERLQVTFPNYQKEGSGHFRLRYYPTSGWHTGWEVRNSPFIGMRFKLLNGMPEGKGYVRDIAILQIHHRTEVPMKNEMVLGRDLQEITTAKGIRRMSLASRALRQPDYHHG